MKRIVFMTGGPAFHPVGEQAAVVGGWLGPEYQCDSREGEAAFLQLGSADLLVVMGLFWPGMEQDWAGKLPYKPLRDGARTALATYARSGRPIISHHGGIASYPEAPEFAAACGWAWVWGETTHSPFGRWTTRPTDPGHPLVEGVSAFSIEDEIYYKVKVLDPAAVRVHATADFEGAAHPMVSSMEAVSGGRGRRVYLANGHDMKAFAGEGAIAMKRLWQNSVRWALGR